MDVASISEVRIPSGLEEELLSNRLVLFVGAGLSRAAQAPGWPELIRELVL